MASNILCSAVPYNCRPLTSSESKSSSFLGKISCGPRDNRGALVRGRVLSTEAMLAIQTLKRASARGSNEDDIISKTFLRLIKSDLLASLRELLRQDKCQLALKVFAAVRQELWSQTDYALNAEMISALSRNGMASEIDNLVSELLKEEFYAGDNRGLARLLKTLIAADKAKSVVDIYWWMKRGNFIPDEYMFKVLSRGLRRLGEAGVADEVDKDFACFLDGRFRKTH